MSSRRSRPPSKPSPAFIRSQHQKHRAIIGGKPASEGERVMQDAIALARHMLEMGLPNLAVRALDGEPWYGFLKLRVESDSRPGAAILCHPAARSKLDGSGG
jgi:hypothetical protein